MTTLILTPEVTVVSMANPDWRRAACQFAEPDLFHSPGDADDEPYYPSSEALAYCRTCPIRVDCLAFGMAVPYGIWGGMTYYQRRQLARTVSRLTCPGCGAHDVVVEGRFEVCLPCGTSWPALP